MKTLVPLTRDQIETILKALVSYKGDTQIKLSDLVNAGRGIYTPAYMDAHAKVQGIKNLQTLLRSHL